MPERLLQRLTLAAAAYGLPTLPVLGGSETVRLNKAMIESLIEEIVFVGARLNDELATTWANVLATRALPALASPEPILTVEASGEPTCRSVRILVGERNATTWPSGQANDLRHAHAALLLAGGADLKTVMGPVGHGRIQTTQKYLHAPPDPQEAR